MPRSMRGVPWIATWMIVLACRSEDSEPVAVEQAEASPARARVTTSDDKNLGVLLAEIVDSRACQDLRNTYRALHGVQNPDVVAGTLWIRECAIESDGTNVTVRLAGDGWEWLHQKKEEAEAHFAVQQYIKFHVAATIRGTIDVSYAPKPKLVTVRFTPSGQPAVQFQPIGNVSVDEQGIWASIIGSVESVVSESPSQQAQQEVQKQGAQSFVSMLDQGVTITVDACTGQVRAGFGKSPEVTTPKLSAAKPSSAPIVVHQGGLLVFGPETVGEQMTVVVDVSSGTVHIDVACRAQADKLADAFRRGAPLPALKTLASGDVTSSARLRVADGHCPVAVIAQARTPAAKFSWKREPPAPSGEPLIECPKRTAPSRGN